jgi:hypothetical protein
MLNNLGLSTDYTSLHLCMNFVGAFLRGYIGDYKPRLVNRKPRFYQYRFPQERTDRVWVERDLCSCVREATNALMSRLAPAESIYFLVNTLLHLGGRAAQVGDNEALEDLAYTFADMSERFEGYWIIRFQTPDAEEEKALTRVETL